MVKGRLMARTSSRLAVSRRNTGVIGITAARVQIKFNMTSRANSSQ
jgi:hypothetical protein